MSRAAVIEGPRRVRLVDMPAAAHAATVRVRPLAVGLCGSDIHGFSGRTDRRAPGTVMGHEIAARVDDHASPLHGRLVVVDPVRSCGACPACRDGAENLCASRRLYGCVPELPGGFADEMRVAPENLVAVPDGVDPAVMALCEPLAVGVHAAARAGVAGHSVAVIGAGAIGLGAALAARRAGAARVVVSEHSPHRRAIAARLGLDAVSPDALAAGSVEVALECAGHAATLDAALRVVGPGGTVVCVGLSQRVLDLDAVALVMGERTLRGSAVYTHAEFTETARWLSTAADAVAPLVEQRIALDELPRVLARYADGLEHAVKTSVVAP